MENLRGILLMTLAMAGFAIEDMFVKMSARALHVGQIILILGIIGALVFGGLTLRRGHRLLLPELLRGPLLLRNLCELVGTACFVTAIALTPLATASAILQAMPLMVTLGAALFLGAEVGWRRWSAIGLGFVGVLLVIRPGLDGFQPAALFALAAAVALAARDLATRVMPRTVTNMQMSAYGFASVVPLGAVMMMLGGGPAPMTADLWWLMAGAAIGGIGGYYAITAAMRMGEIAVVTPYRYSRLLFALIIGLIVFDERPDGWTLAGAALIIASGLYTLAREARVKARRAA